MFPPGPDDRSGRGFWSIMGKYVLKRLAHLIWILLAVSFLTFLLMYLAPGDAAEKKLNAQGISVSQEVLEPAKLDLKSLDLLLGLRILKSHVFCCLA